MLAKSAKVDFEGDGFSKRNAIVFAGREFCIGTRVHRWNEKSGFNGYTKKHVHIEEEDRATGKVKVIDFRGPRYRHRRAGLKGIKQFFIHHSGGDGNGAGNIFRTLYMYRNLSVTYVVDDDGQIWQFNDALDVTRHGGSHNQMSIGVECCLFPFHDEKPNYYSEKRNKRTNNLPHKTKIDTIHGQKIKVFCFTDPQVDALARLGAGNWLALQILKGTKTDDLAPPVFPRNARGNIPRTTVKNPKGHTGLIGHLQVTRRKPDPAGFPWEEYEEKVHDYFWTFAAGNQELYL